MGGIINDSFPDCWAWDYIDEGYLEELIGCYKVITETITLFEE